MNIDLSTHNEIVRFLGDEISLADFLAWLRPVEWSLGDEDLRKQNPLTRRVALYSAEYKIGHRTDAELRDLLAEASRTVWLESLSPESLALTLRMSKRWEFGTNSAEATEESFGGDTPLAEGFVRATSQHPRTERQTTRVLLGPPHS
jgi:hypothetical protein